MTHLTDTPSPTGPFDLAELDRVDRILLGSSVVVWLAALGAAVAATVALVDLARGGAASSAGDSGTPWFLYTVIGVSAGVIVAAVPLLLRARRAAEESPAATPRTPPTAPDPAPVPLRGAEAPTEKFRAARPTAVAEPSGPIPRVLAGATATEDTQGVDQLWLRCAAAIACAMGVATLLTSVSTYLMAVDTDTVAWVLYGLAGVITLGMVAIPLYFLRELRALIDSH